MRIYQSDWLTNAGILGFLRIQKLRGKEYDLSQGFIEISADDLQGFEDAFFSYTLMKGFSFFLKFDAIKKLQKHLNDDTNSKLQEELRGLTQQAADNISPDWNSFEHTVDSAVDQVTRLVNSIRSVIEAFISNDEKLKKKMVPIITDIDMLSKGTGKKKIKVKKVDEIKNEKYDYITTQLKRFYFNKKIVGQYAFKGNNRKKAFVDEYIVPAQNTLANPTRTNGISCRFCKQNYVSVTNFDEVNKFFGEGLFSPIGITLAFQNFFYNMQPDFVVCDVCELLLLCAWAGFTDIPWKFRDEINDTEFIYVNVPSLRLLWEENQKIQNLYNIANLDLQGTVYEEIVYDLLVKEKQLRSQWALQNILFVEIKPVPRKDQGKPNFRYFHIGKEIAETFKDEFVTEGARRIKGRIYSRRNKESPRDSVFVYARRDMIRRLLGRDSFYPLCYAALRDHIDNPSITNVNNCFNLSLISGIRKNIWIKHKKGVSSMESKQVFGILKGFSGCGESLGEKMDFDKRKRLSYRLLSLIRTGKTADLYEALMKLYISQNRPIPEILVTMLNKEDAIEPEAKAYAFMSGFLGEHEPSSNSQTAVQSQSTTSKE